MFCQLEVLRHCFPSSVRHILEELPDSLDDTYERILREIRKPNQGHAHRLLQCLVAAVRPLRVKELAEVLAFDFNAEGIPKLNLGWRWEDQEEAVMSACSSLVMIVKDGDSRIVQFSHFSVKEFLTANRLAEPIRDVSRYHIRLEAAHTILAQACLGVLLRLDDHVDRDNIENFPLARYAAQYWPTHARFENASSRIKDGMECLFDADKPHFATWLWIYNEIGDGRSMSTMSPEKPEAVPLYYAARLGFRDLAEHLIAKHPEHVNARGGRRSDSDACCSVRRTCRHFVITTRTWRRCGWPGQFWPDSTASSIVEWKTRSWAVSTRSWCRYQCSRRRWLDPTVCRRCTKDKSSLLGCYLNAGQGLMP